MRQILMPITVFTVCCFKPAFTISHQLNYSIHFFPLLNLALSASRFGVPPTVTLWHSSPSDCHQKRSTEVVTNVPPHNPHLCSTYILLDQQILSFTVICFFITVYAKTDSPPSPPHKGTQSGVTLTYLFFLSQHNLPDTCKLKINCKMHSLKPFSWNCGRVFSFTIFETR